jgi:GT2 family glycosyltransferase
MTRNGEDPEIAARAGAVVQDQSMNARVFAVAVPLLDDTKLAVDMFDDPAAEQTVFSFPFSPLASKIKSRLLYRRHHNEAMQLRDIDQRRFSGQPYVYVTGIYCLTADAVTCRFHATVPYEAGARYEAFVVDAAGNSVGANMQMLEDCVVSDRHDRHSMLRELSYSVRLRGSDRTLCVNVVQHGAPAAQGCFACLWPSDVDGFTNGATEELRHASQDPQYPEWFERHRATPADVIRQRRRCSQWDNRPLISIVTPVFRTPAAYLRAMIASVLAQSYGRFELILVNVSGVYPAVDAVLAEFDDPRIRVIVAENLSISENTNVGIEAAEGDYLAFVDHDDTIEPDALYRYMSVVQEDPQTDLMYCDEDHLKTDHYEWPTFKPDFNPDLLYTHNYITHMLMVSRHALSQIELSGPEVAGAQDYDLTLKCSQVARSIHNVPYMLYHWREHANSTSVSIGSKPYAVEAGSIALHKHFERMGLDVAVHDRAVPCTYAVDYQSQQKPLISIIIPTKDHADMLSVCLESIVDKTAYDNYEIVCVENNSTDDATFEYYEEIQRRSQRIRVVTWPGQGFNYSAICNFGASQCKGDIMLFLNNDTEVINGDWLGSMVNFFGRPDVGVVGAKLYNYDGLVQHGGVLVVPGGLDYINQNFSENGTGYMNLLRFPSDMAAVTGACQMISRKVFDEVGGFDEDFAVSLNDVDICLKAKQHGYVTVFDPDASLYHRESSSRGRDDLDVRKLKRLENEKFRFFSAWPNLERGHFVNINLDQYNGHFKIA